MRFIIFVQVVIGTHISIISENDQESRVEFINELSTFKIAADGVSTYCTLDDESLISYSEEELTTNVDLLVQNIEFIDFLGRLEFNESPQFVLWSHEGFEQAIEGWSDARTSVCGTSSNMFLGGPCLFSKKPVNKQYENLPEHTQVKISFNFNYFDEWEGEVAKLEIDGQTVWQENYSWCEKVMPWRCTKFGINVCGSQTPDQLNQYYEVTLPHEDSSMFLEFSATLVTKDACTASWGIDNVSIYIL